MKSAPVDRASPGGLVSAAELERAAEHIRALLAALDGVLLDQEGLVRDVVVTLLSRGHVLLEGVPGLGKTQLVRSLAALVDLPFRRIQFTPDLLPSDITGTYVLERADGSHRFEFHEGPIFSSFVLADEINRASPKTQSALLEAMQERTVTAGNCTFALPEPFFVMATQNPIELEGTYPLPEAQLDRFRCKLLVEGVGAATLEKIVRTRPDGEPPPLAPVLGRDEFAGLLDLVPRIHVSGPVAAYIAALVAASHPAGGSLQPVRDYVRFGASPRAALSLAQTARARALVAGAPNVSFDAVRASAPGCLRHRIILDYRARVDSVGADDIVGAILEATPVLAGVAVDTLEG